MGRLIVIDVDIQPGSEQVAADAVSAAAFRRDRIDRIFRRPVRQGLSHGVRTATPDIGRTAIGGGDDPPHAYRAEQAAVGLQRDAARQGLGGAVARIEGQETSIGHRRRRQGAQAGERATPREAQALFEHAVKYMDANGPERAFAAFNDRKGEFVRKDLYVFVIDDKGVYHASGAAPEALVGLTVLNTTDAAGNPLFREMIERYEREKNVPAIEIAAALAKLPDGEWSFEDWIDDDGVDYHRERRCGGHDPIGLRSQLRVDGGGRSRQVEELGVRGVVVQRCEFVRGKDAGGEGGWVGP